MLDINTTITVAGETILILMLAYAALLAYNIRRGLVVPLYRRQALGIGLISVGFVYFTSFLSFSFVFPSTGAAAEVTFFLFVYSLFPLFYWTDASLLAARESDPLGRDHFHWSRLRKVLWTLYGVTLATELAILIVVTFFPNNPVTLWQPPFGLFIFELLTPIVLPLASAAILLPFAARRSGDLTFRNHLKWFGRAVVLFVLGFAQLIITYTVVQVFAPQLLLDGNSPIGGLVLYAFVIASGYCLYRSVKAVVPLYAFETKAQ